MDATFDLARLLAEWRRLTHLEGEAILGDNWQGVAEHQTRKTQLQSEIRRALASFRTISSAQAHTCRTAEGEFDSVVGELMALERRNGDLIAAKRNRRQTESERLAGTLLDLHGIRRAYGSSRACHWQSYS
jgi:fructose-1,6-bisphosphatase/inositol monophosphatase family enzyme